MDQKTNALKTLRWAQTTLEDFYGAQTGLDVRDFVKTIPNLNSLGKMHVEQAATGDIDLALFFDRDIFAAWESTQHHRPISVFFEEVSHFVYLGFNHRRCRNISSLEMELQSEVDRILLAFHDEAPSLCKEHKNILLHEVQNLSYSQTKQDTYEQARRWAAQLLTKLSNGNPLAWGENEKQMLRDFFHKDLAEKIHILRS